MTYQQSSSKRVFRQITFAVYGIRATFILVCLCIITACDGEDESNSFTLQLRIYDGSTTVHQSNYVIKDYPIVRGSDLPHVRTVAYPDETNRLYTRFLDTSLADVRIGWIAINRKDDSDNETDLTQVGQGGSFYSESLSDVDFYAFTLPQVGVLTDDTVEISFDTGDVLRMVPSQSLVSVFELSVPRSELGVPDTLQVAYLVQNTTSSSLMIVEKQTNSSYDLDFIVKGHTRISWSGELIPDTLKFMIFGFSP